MRIKCLTSILFTVSFCLGLAACAPQQQAAETGSESGGESLAIGTEWSPDADCSVCHAAEQASLENKACLASLHTSASCVDCHTDDTALAAVHEGIGSSDKLPSKLKQSQVSDDTCLVCHYGSRDALAEATPDVMISDSQGNGRNPHLSDGIVDHDSMDCASCHGMHKEGSSEAQAKKACESCHHAGVYQCYTCHE